LKKSTVGEVALFKTSKRPDAKLTEMLARNRLHVDFVLEKYVEIKVFQMSGVSLIRIRVAPMTAWKALSHPGTKEVIVDDVDEGRLFRRQGD
jgi:hypothetical protein